MRPVTRVLVGFVVLAVPAGVAVGQTAPPAIGLPRGDGDDVRRQLGGWTRPSAPASTGEPLAAPVALGRLSSGFGVRSDPFGRGQRRHEGIDMPGAPGSPVRAAGDGVVVFAHAAGSYGNLIEVDHGNGLTTRYAHLSTVDVARGASVRSGDQIGRMGSTGRSTGSHLHFEVRLDGVPTDPLARLAVRGGRGSPSPPPIAARWSGWSDGGSDDRLPGARLR